MTSNVARLLADLVRLESPSGYEGPVSEFVADLFTRAGLEVERLGEHGFTVLVRLAKGRGPRFLMNSHLDTVPVGSGWTKDPLAAVWEDGRLYGRGSNDAKASVAAMTQALLGLAERDFRGEVWLALNAGEETTNQGMRDVLARTGLPDGAVTGEPTGLEVVRAQAGLAVLRASWSGRSCHAAHVERVEHRNALLAAASDLTETWPWVRMSGEHPLLGVSTLVATVFHSGERHNIVPDHAEALFDARLAPPHDGEDAAALLAELLPNAAVEVRSARLKPVETAEDHPLVRAALRCAGRERAIGSSTLSDMALLSGVPAVKCGPGQTARSHTPDEYVELDELEAGTAFYEALIPEALEALNTEAVVR